jgi:hypothetical protein
LQVVVFKYEYIAMYYHALMKEGIFVAVRDVWNRYEYLPKV